MKIISIKFRLCFFIFERVVINIHNKYLKKDKINFKRIINLIYQTDKRYLLIVFIISIVSGSAPIISINLMQKILNLIQVDRNNVKTIFTYVILYLIVDFITLIIGSLVAYYNLRFELKLNLKVQNLVHIKVSQLPLKSFENSEVYDRIKRAEENVHSNIMSVVSVIVTIITSIISITLYTIKFINFNKILIFVIMAVPIIKFLVINKINLIQYSIIRKRTNDERKAWYYSYLITNGDTFKEFKINNLFGYFIEKYNYLIKKFNKQDVEIEKNKIIKLGILEFVEQILDGSIFSFIVWKCILRQILIGDAITYMKVTMNLKGDIRNFLNSFSSLKKDSLYINMFFELLELEEETLISKNMRKSSIDTIINEGTDELLELDEIITIELKHVFFRYKEEQNYILKDINLKLEKGKSIAIVGVNGSGKTTLAKLLMGFYNEYEGEILINGVDFKKIEINNYRKKIGALFQDFVKYEATFKENICYGNLELFDDNSAINNIVEKFSLESIFENDSDDYNLQLGYWFDSGRQISIGQWHKIALARTFSKNADLYLLDEPNSSLDSINEESVSDLFINSIKNKIGIIVTHRFINIVKKVNLIIVMGEGEITEVGMHKELIDLDGEYKKLYSAQLGNDEAFDIQSLNV